MMMKHGVTSLTTDRVLTETQQTVSLHLRNTADEETRVTEICVTSSVIEMHSAGLKTDARSTSA
jgi:hypothetical protein